MNAQLRKAGPLILVAVLAILLFAIRQCKNNGQISGAATNSKNNNPGATDRDRGFDRRTSFLEYSNHAKCRMECRKISPSEVEEIMKEGKVNYNKSDIQNTRCPRYAIEGVTTDDQKVRVVFAQCNEKTTVVTVIDLRTDWTCHCPGDDKRYDNKN